MHEATKGRLMILNVRLSLSMLFTVFLFATCGLSNANASTPTIVTPTADALLALDKQATEAYIKGDSNFFETFLSEKMVMQQGGTRLSKADIVKMISGVKCVVKDSWAITKPQMLEIDVDTYVLSYESSIQGSCTIAGKSEAMLGPVRAASVFIRNGDKWQVAFHGENLIIDPTAPPVADKKEDENAVANVNIIVDPAQAKLTADTITTTLMTAENNAWDAWIAKDAKRIEALMANDVAFIDIFGNYSANKVDAIKVWTSSVCDISSFSLTNGVGTTVSPNVAILTLTGTVNGNCGGTDISGQKIFGNTVYVKVGNEWKWVFGFNSPK
jgi:ketosteroid isomerase-like protein